LHFFWGPFSVNLLHSSDITLYYIYIYMIYICVCVCLFQTTCETENSISYRSVGTA
jgi:hypothetical protein